MTIGQHIAAIRGIINQHGETETPFSDEFIYHHFSVVAAKLTKQKYDRNRVFNAFNWKYYCVALERGNVHGCGCIGAGCEVLISKFKIPNPIMGRSMPFLRVMTVDHRDMAYINPSASGAISLDPIRRNKIHWSIVNGFLVLFGANVSALIPRAILIGGFFEDPTAWSDINACSPEGEELESTCYTIKDDDFPIDADLVFDAYQLTIRQTGIPLTIEQDRTNDGILR